jgi:hypothetical protein
VSDSEIKVEDRGLFILPISRARARRVVLFRARIVDGLPYLCFLDTFNSRRGRDVEVAVPLHQLIELVMRSIVKEASLK